jgi:glycosyltransferase involved in cell wall biosynthesis
MRIALVSTAYKATPPSGYGGIERVVFELAEELVRQGHDVLLFGARGSHCSGRTVEIAKLDPAQAPSGITREEHVVSEEPLYTAMRETLREFRPDVVHDWSFQNLYLLRHPEAHPFLISTCVPPAPGYARPNLVACSRAHAELFGPTTRHVHYGLDLSRWGWSKQKAPHLIHIAKIARYKGQHLSILAARKSGRPLHLAGNVEDPAYWHLVVRPLVWISPGVRWVGEIPGTAAHLREAKALVQAPRWFEAYPLVVLEAAASGTPVIALAEGGIPEQIEPGVNGFLCRDRHELATAMARVDELDPAACRAYAEERFTAARMAEEYAALYAADRDGERW